MIKILLLAANPTDTPPLRLDEESRAIDQALRQADFRGEFEIEQHWAVRASDLQGLFLRHQPHIVHFSGHGSAASEIILQNDDGNSQPVSSTALKGLFSLFNATIRCVVLNACYSEQQAKSIAEEIDCVIGMSDAILDDASLQFAAAFYQALGYGKDIKTAFELGCLQIDLESLGDQDKPQLFASRTEPAEVFLVTATEEHQLDASNAATHKRRTSALSRVALTAAALISVLLMLYIFATRGNTPSGATGTLQLAATARDSQVDIGQAGVITTSSAAEPTFTPTPIATQTPSPTATPSFTVKESAKMLLAAAEDKNLDQVLQFICAAQRIKLTTAASWPTAFADLTNIDGLAGGSKIYVGSGSDGNYEWDYSSLSVDTVFENVQHAELRIFGSLEGRSPKGTLTTYISTTRWQMVYEEGVWRLCPAPITKFGKIIYVSQQDGHARSYSMYADGSEQTFLMENPEPFELPAWSPDGQKVAFVVQEKDVNGYRIQYIDVMNVDGSDRVRLTNSETDKRFLSWSPDGQKMAFVSGWIADPDLYVLNADGSGLTRVIDSPSRLVAVPADEQGAAPLTLFIPVSLGENAYTWAANNQQIAFTAELDHDELQIYVVSVDGSNLRPLTKIGGGNIVPAWSPDGQRIAFVSAAAGKGQLNMMNADGSNLNLLTREPTNVSFYAGLHWSPDSQKIAFWAANDDNSDFFLYAINADGTGQTLLTADSDELKGHHLVWSPDSQQLAFASKPLYSEEKTEVDVIYADGTGRKQLTTSSGDDYPIAWLP